MGAQTCQASGSFSACVCEGVDAARPDVADDATADLGIDEAIAMDGGPDVRGEDVASPDLGSGTATDLGIDAATDIGISVDMDLGVDTATDISSDGAAFDVGGDRGGSDLGQVATTDAAAGVCARGFADCDGNPVNGCETSLTATSNCGACDVTCVRANASATCASGVCAVATCNDRFGDCDGNGVNGCETALDTPANCGACRATCTRANATTACVTGVCAIGACFGGFGDCDRIDADGCETPLRTTANCGACGVVCSRANASASCASGTCSISSCNPGFADCDGSDANGCETSLTTLGDCGACRATCARANATASCSSGVCRTTTCSAGFADCDGNDANGCEAALNTTAHCGSCGVSCGAGADCVDGVCLVLAAPRLLAPLSTATVTSRRPLLRWAPVSGSLGTRVQICRDRACRSVISTIDTVSSDVTPSTELPTGVVFWRAFGRAGTILGSAPSPTWQMVVGARSAPINVSAGSVFDANGDGYADLAVGAQCAPATGLNSCGGGRVHVYPGGVSGVGTSPARTLAAISTPTAYFGDTISAGDLNGDGYADLVIGAAGASSNRGSVHVYAGSAEGVGSLPTRNLDGPSSGASFGVDLSAAGDVNGDGYADLVVGSAGTVSGVSGRVYVHLGGPNGVSDTRTTIAAPDGGGFGIAVASASDVNGDGYADILVGASGVASNTGRAYVFMGGALGAGALPAVTLMPPIGGANTLFGNAVASAGDVNGDGYTDLLVGAYGTLNNVGRAYLYLGSATGIGAVPSVTLAPPSMVSIFGYPVASVGDVNADGYGDIAISGSNSVYVYLGHPTGLQTTPVVALFPPDGMNSLFGNAMAGMGDSNGDGYADLIVGDQGFNSFAGRAFVYLGNSLGFDTMPTRALTAPDGIWGRFGVF